MSEHDFLARLQEVSQSAAFNRWIGLEVVAAEQGHVTIALPWRDEFGQYARFLHAALIGGLIDTACGFAAGTHAPGGVLASHFSVNCLAPAVGERFIARGTVIKAGRTQIFTRGELFAVESGKENLVATGEAILVPVGSK